MGILSQTIYVQYYIYNINCSVYSSRIIEIQQQLSERALELLALPDNTPCLILDVGYV